MPPTSPRDTPAMQQYARFKRRHPDCLLLFRIGDFYELFDDDAVTASRALGLTLTQRTEGVPMAGVPYHQLEVYLRRLIDHGFRVAVAEQVQDASQAKGLIERDVTRVLTPGTLVDDALLADDQSSSLGAACFLGAGDAPDTPVALAIAEISSGRFTVLQCPAASLVDELARRSVTELLYPDTADGKPPPRIKAVLDALRVSGSPQPAWHFRLDEAREALLTQYRVGTLDGFGLAADDPVIAPAGAIIRYLRLTQTPSDEARPSPIPAQPANAGAAPRPATGGWLAHLAPPRREDPAGSCIVDATSLRSLEILHTLRSGGARGSGAGDTSGSLIGIFTSSRYGAGCKTPMGRRLLREWLCRPLADLDAIRARHRAVGTFVEDRTAAAALTAALAGVQDVTRIAARLALGRASPRDLVALGRSLSQIDAVAATIQNAPALATHADAVGQAAQHLAPLAQQITDTCVESPPNHLREGGLIRDGIDAPLDEARLLQRDAASWLAAYQKRLIDEHALPGVKVGYNKVFGYFIELTKAQARASPPPASFTRKQTLTNAERYTTPELKDFEDKVTTAQARGVDRETALFAGLCAAAANLIAPIQRFADAAAELDVLACFADKAVRRRWVEPQMVEPPVLLIHHGRHPVLDELLDTNFVPNDIELGPLNLLYDGPDTGETTAPGGAAAAPSLALITGPNMAGKSTFIRQTALIVLLAHAGSFVPADRATIGLTDRIFTRVGADDALHAGQSTFMIEMTETARILHHASARSLIILDEIGRGTSTLDGLSLAWAIAESLAGGIKGSGEQGIKGARNQGSKGEPSRTRSLDPSIPRSLPPRTLFATHYHELTDLQDRLPGRVMNLHVEVREWGEDIVFLHRILPGRTSQSYGIHVARLAGVPDAVIRRARDVLDSLAVHHTLSDAPAPPAGSPQSDPPARLGAGGPSPRQARANSAGQLSLFTEYLSHPAVDQLREIKIDSLTPLEAFDALRHLKQLTDGQPPPTH